MHGALEECTNMRAAFGAATAVHQSGGGVFLVWLGVVLLEVVFVLDATANC